MLIVGIYNNYKHNITKSILFIGELHKIKT